MKINNKIIFLILGFLLLFNITFSIEINSTDNNTGINFVEDNANLIDYETEIEINQILENLYNSEKAEFKIITIDTLNNTPIEMYSLNLAQEKIGFENLNNGILLLISKDDKEYRFEIGRGLESILTDSKIGKIGRDNLVFNFQNQEYSKAVLETTKIISKLIDEKYMPNNYKSKTTNINNYNLYFYLLFLILIGFIIRLFNLKSKSLKVKSNNFNNKLSYSKNLKKTKSSFKQKNVLKKKGKFGGGGVTGRW